MKENQGGTEEKLSELCSLFFNYPFEIIRFTGTCKDSKESPCTLYSVPDNGYILHNYSAMSKPGN